MFFRRDPSTTYRGRQGRGNYSYNSHHRVFQLPARQVHESQTISPLSTTSQLSHPKERTHWNSTYSRTQPPRSRIRLTVGVRTQKPACRWLHSPFYAKLGTHHAGPLGPQYSPGLQTGPSNSSPTQNSQPQLDTQKPSIISQEVGKLKQKKAISCIRDDQRGLISPIFVVPKADGSWRPVINLQGLNRHVRRCHFKMDNQNGEGSSSEGRLVGQARPQGCFLTIPIHGGHRKYI